MKKKIIILSIIAVVLIITGLVIILIMNKPASNKKTTEDKNTEKDKIPQEVRYDIDGSNGQYDCESKIKTTVLNYENIKCKYKEKYSFVVASDNKISSNGYKSILYFDNIEDLDKYYTHLVDTSLLPEKDTKALTITYSNLSVQGGYEKFDNGYLDYLANHGLKCKKVR